jgi:hypothetical protein
LLYFIGGIMFAVLGLPILESISILIVSLLEIPKGKCAVKVAEYNQQISKLGDEDEIPKRLIGFQISEAEEEDEEENDEDC